MSNLNDPQKVSDLIEVLIHAAENRNRKLKIETIGTGSLRVTAGIMHVALEVDFEISSGRWFLES